jgi:hypothetical protein
VPLAKRKSSPWTWKGTSQSKTKTGPIISYNALRVQIRAQPSWNEA